MNSNTLDKIMGTQEAATLWNCSEVYVKKLCERKKIPAVKIGKTWITLRNQPNPVQKNNP